MIFISLIVSYMLKCFDIIYNRCIDEEGNGTKFKELLLLLFCSMLFESVSFLNPNMINLIMENDIGTSNDHHNTEVFSFRKIWICDEIRRKNLMFSKNIRQ